MGEGARLEVAGDHRQGLLANEGADGVPDQALVVAEELIDLIEV
jgi:hypothetical protein